MAKGIDLAIAADTRSAMSAINRGLLEPLEDVSEVLEKVGDDSKDAGDRLERGMRDAQRRTEDAKDEIRQLRDELNKAGRAGKDAGRDIDDGLDQVSDTSREVGDELRGNIGEAFSSFRGDLEDLPQIAQDTLGGLAGSGALGGIAGVAATAAGAAGLGLIIGAIDAINEAAEKSEERANELAGAYIDAGSTVLSTLDSAARISEVVTDKELREEATRLADTIGIDLAEAVRIVAGDANALAGAQSILAGRQQEVNDKMNTGTELSAQRIIEIQEERSAVIGQVDALDVYSERQDIATQRATLYSDSLKSIVDDAGTVTVEVDELGNKLVTLPDQTQIFIDAQTQQASTNVDQFKGDFDQKVDQMNGRDVTLNARASMDEAENAVDSFVARNDGKHFRVIGRVTFDKGQEFG